MQTRVLRNIFFAAAISASLNAQATLIVNSDGSGQYTDVQPALDAANPGDTIEVQAGFYSEFTVAKGVSLLVDPGAEFGLILGPATTIVIQDIPIGQTAIVRGLSVVHRSNGIGVLDCAGHVHLENCTAQTAYGITNSSQVTLHNMTFHGAPGLRAMDSTVVATQCNVIPWGTGSFLAGLECLQSDVTFAHGTIMAPPPLFFGPIPAARVTGGVLTIAGDSQTVLDASLGQSAAIEVREGTLVLDPAVTLIPTLNQPPVFVTTGTTESRSVPTLRTDLAAQQLSIEAFAAPGSTATTVIGITQSPPIVLPFGTLWFNLHIPIDAGVVPASGTRAFSVTIPAVPPGLHAVLQSVVVTPTAIELSVPAVRTLDG